MKKLLVLAFLLFPVFAFCDEIAKDSGSEEETIIVYDVFKHRNNSENSFLAIGGGSLAAGIITAASSGTNEISRNIGIQLAAWGIAETAVAIFDKNRDNKERDPEKARLEIVDFSQFRLWVDLGIFAAGTCMVIWGDTPYKGHGAGLMINSAVLAMFDSINLVVASNPEDVRDWGSPEKTSAVNDTSFILTYNGIRF